MGKSLIKWILGNVLKSHLIWHVTGQERWAVMYQSADYQCAILEREVINTLTGETRWERNLTKTIAWVTE